MRRGLTLLEIVLAGAILLMLIGVVLEAFRMGWGARRTQDAATDAYRACMVAQSHLRAELKGVQLLCPVNSDASPTLTFRRSSLVDGNLKVDSSGEPIWGKQATVKVDGEGRLVCTDDCEPERILARLGAGGKVEFRRTDKHLLDVMFHTERKDRDRPDLLIPYEVKDTVYLPNQ